MTPEQASKSSNGPEISTFKRSEGAGTQTAFSLAGMAFRAAGAPLKDIMDKAIAFLPGRTHVEPQPVLVRYADGMSAVGFRFSQPEQSLSFDDSRKLNPGFVVEGLGEMRLCTHLVVTAGDRVYSIRRVEVEDGIEWRFRQMESGAKITIRQAAADTMLFTVGEPMGHPGSGLPVIQKMLAIDPIYGEQPRSAAKLPVEELDFKVNDAAQ